MTFESIYIQDNFVPDYVTDPFRRKVIGVNIIIQSGETREQAEKEAEEYIADYIKRNTIDRQAVQIKDIEPKPPAPSQPKLSPEETMIKDINSCKEVKVLETYRLLVKKNPKFQDAYNLKYEQLDQLQIQKQVK